MSANFNFTSDSELLNDFIEGDKPLPKGRADVAPAEPQLRQLPALNYDFDIVEIAPDPAQQAHLDALAALGRPTDHIQVEARWRDPHTVAALAKASRGVRTLFAESGFGTVPSGADLAPNTYPAKDAEARHEIVMRLTNMLAQTDASAFDWGQIDCPAFFQANGAAEPIRTTTTQHTTSSSSQTRRKLALVGLAVGIALLVTAGFAAL